MTVFVFGQTPPVKAPDPHEDPKVQNAPEGKKLPDQPEVPSKGLDPTAKTTPAATSAKGKQAAAAPPALEHDEAMLGTWVLVKEKSKFVPGPGPQAETRTYTRTPAGIVARVETTLSDGTVEVLEFPWQEDGSEQVIKGSKIWDHIQLRQVNNLTAEASLRHGTKELARERREVAADGKSMTLTVTDMVSEEHPVTATAVYEKR